MVSYNPETIANMIAAARGAGISVIVRIPEITRENILKPLDAGATGLLVPMVNSAAEARRNYPACQIPDDG